MSKGVNIFIQIKELPIFYTFVSLYLILLQFLGFKNKTN